MRRRVPGAVVGAITFCIASTMLRVPCLLVAFALARFYVAFNDDSCVRATVLPALLVAPGVVLVVRMLATAARLGLRRPLAASFARATIRWVRLHQVGVSLILPVFVLVADTPLRLLPTLLAVLTSTSVVWATSASLEHAARTIERLDARAFI